MSASDLPQDRALRPPPPGWQSFQSTQEYLSRLPGHRERVTAEAWFDREQQSLMLVLTQYDESMSEFVPCWQQLHLMEVGPFTAKKEVQMVAEQFTDTVVLCWGLPE